MASTPSWGAFGPYGNLLASFGSQDLAERWAAERATAIGLSVTIKRIVQQTRRVA